MLIPIDLNNIPEENKRCMADLIQNANSKEYTNVKGFKQKYIDLMYKLGYYKDNESLFERKSSQIWSLQLV